MKADFRWKATMSPSVCSSAFSVINSEAKSMKEAVHVFVAGMVQGVFYRSWAEQTARQLGLKGWVRNLPDGRVEAVFEGNKKSVERMVGLCRKGPPHAKVENVDARKERASGFEGFEVRR